ncbi:MAG: metallophosphoesterase [Candidatus Moranbacteria bacterium]|nr:metallophosphoesterase [Candidatus Moranbacteria bacterium]
MIILQVIFFLLLAIILLFGSHYFLYASLVKFFPFFSSHKNGLIITLGLLAVSFILTSFLAHMREDIFTRTSYFLSGFWLGLLTNLLLALVLLWFLHWLLPLVGININFQIVAAIFFSLAFLVSLYGTWNAFEPRIKNIAVTIPNLPQSWQGKKVVQLSDVHLGLIYQKNFLEKIVAKTNSLDPDLVVITGDLFDGTDNVDLETLTAPLDNLKAKQGTFFINGNHETYLGLDKAYVAVKKTPAQVLDDQVVNLAGLKLIGLSYPERDLKKDVVATLEKLKPQFFGSPNILLYHSPTNITQFAENGINLQLSGHTHLGQIFPFNFITKLIYRGYDYGLHTIGNYTLYTSSGIGTWGPAMRTDSTPEIVVITLH